MANTKTTTTTITKKPSSINSIEGMAEAGLKALEDMKFEFTAEAIEHSFGIVLLEAIQIGFFVTAGLGTGILMRHDKKNKSWSPPIAVGLSNLGAGIAAGLELKHMIIVLSEKQMMETMSSDFSFRITLDTSVAVGPFGEEIDVTGQVGNKGGSMMNAISYTEGAYFGVELQGAALAPRNKVNEKYYGKVIPTKKVLFGVVENAPKCESVDRLHAKLHEIAANSQPAPTPYVETIARPFAKNTDKTNVMEE